jgi:hypothetical protein
VVGGVGHHQTSKLPISAPERRDIRIGTKLTVSFLPGNHAGEPIQPDVPRAAYGLIGGLMVSVPVGAVMAEFCIALSADMLSLVPSVVPVGPPPPGVAKVTSFERMALSAETAALIALSTLAGSSLPDDDCGFPPKSSADAANAPVATAAASNNVSLNILLSFHCTGVGCFGGKFYS